MNFYSILFTICCLILYVFAYTDPSVTNPHLVKRFEYKLSFKGPHLAFKDGTVPFWTFGGSAIASDEQVRITPSIRSQKGWIWSKNPLSADRWVLDIKLRVTGRGRVGADGMAVWLTEQPGVEGTVFGSNDQWKGLGIFLDSFDNDALQNNPLIAVMINDGTKSYDHHHDGSSQIQGSCIRDFRNKPMPIRLKIEYINQALTIYINNGISQDDNAFEFCTRVERAQLPKVGYLGVTAATGALADDHDVLELLTNSYSDRQASPQNQATNDEQTRKYKEEYAKYEHELQQQQADYRKEHPDATTQINEQQLYESEYDREFRVILEGQDQIRLSLTNIDRKIAEILGRVDRLAINGVGQQQITGQPQGTAGVASGVPADVARIQDINRVINANTDMTRTIQSFAQVLTDLQQKVNYLQTNLNNPQAVGTGPQPVGSNTDPKILNELRETIRQIKSETNILLQKTPTQVKCPTIAGISDSSCIGPYTFFAIIALQIVILIGYSTFKNRQNQLSRKYL
jgi:mannose-binding lectin 1